MFFFMHHQTATSPTFREALLQRSPVVSSAGREHRGVGALRPGIADADPVLANLIGVVVIEGDPFWGIRGNSQQNQGI